MKDHRILSLKVERSPDFLAASPTHLGIVFLFPREVLPADSPTLSNNILPVSAWLKLPNTDARQPSQNLVGPSDGFSGMEKKYSVYRQND